MDAVLIMVVAFVGYILMYRFYGRFIGRKIFNLSNVNKVPSVEFEDGKDYVPITLLKLSRESLPL